LRKERKIFRSNIIALVNRANDTSGDRTQHVIPPS
jgi:hypothetical protein